MVTHAFGRLRVREVRSGKQPVFLWCFDPHKLKMVGGPEGGRRIEDFDNGKRPFPISLDEGRCSVVAGLTPYNLIIDLERLEWGSQLPSLAGEPELATSSEIVEVSSGLDDASSEDHLLGGKLLFLVGIEELHYGVLIAHEKPLDGREKPIYLLLVVADHSTKDPRWTFSR